MLITRLLTLLAYILLKFRCGYIRRFLLRLRYEIHFDSPSELRHRKGVLILPNHPAEIDPVILMSLLWADFKPHPVVVEDFFHISGLRFLMDFVGAIPIPNMEGTIGSYKRLRVKKALDRTIACLNQGENVLFYPAGRLMQSGREELRASSGISDILSGVAEKKILLVRTTGLIGSSFSWVLRRKRPDLARCLADGLKYLCLNLLFFMPRRKITVEIMEAPEDFPFSGNRMRINQYLESWFNSRGEEPLSPVSYTFWKETLPDIKTVEIGKETPDIKIPDDIRKKVLEKLAGLSGRMPEEMQDSWNLSGDIGLDSLETADLAAWLEQEFCAWKGDSFDLRTIKDLMWAAVGNFENVPGPAGMPAPREWREKHERPAIIPPDLRFTIQHNFLLACERGRGAVAIADENSGVLTYNRCKSSAILLADIISEYPDRNIGIMLPASVPAALVIMAVLLAGKIPVLINWTAGSANLRHELEIAEVKIILTSTRFLDRLENLDFEIISDAVVNLEYLKNEKSTLFRKIKTLFRCRLSPEAICNSFNSRGCLADNTAVILFTSGSESLPKGVPLTHRNIQSNIKACLESVPLRNDDILYGFLPPFHSFGFTITTVLPLLSGLKTAYYPNPSDSGKLAAGMLRWRPAIICGTPTFISGILKTAAPSQLSSLRLILTGAEKTPDKLFSKVESMCDAELLEGYGITECSPVLTFIRPGEKRAGVGRVVGDTQICILNPETGERLCGGTQGLILVKGSGIFSGYLKKDSADAFMMLDGEQYYVTGDLGYLDDNQNLILTGRLKRFVKIGGEMISLPAMEDVITKEASSEDNVVESALTYLEKPGERPLIGLFTVLDLRLEKINDLLRRSGFGNLVRIHKIIKVDKIPLLGSGKVDYLRLTKLLENEES